MFIKGTRVGNLARFLLEDGESQEAHQVAEGFEKGKGSS
jgi:hypothetical protein